MEDFQWFIAFLVVVVMLWIGGKTAVNRVIPTPLPAKAGVEPAQKSAEVRLKEAEKELRRLQEEAAKALTERDASALKGKLRIVSVARADSPEKEYATIQASPRNNVPVTITGLSFRSGVSRLSYSISTAWVLPFLNATGEGDVVTLRPGERAYLISGRSPLALSTRKPNTTSFQLNKCTGYLERGLDFTPALPRDCPLASKEPLPTGGYELSDACTDYLARIPRCTVPGAVPANLSGDGGCQSYVATKVNYATCVENHKDDADFYRGEWHIYLGRSAPLWRSRNEIVELYDTEGKLIDSKQF